MSKGVKLTPRQYDIIDLIARDGPNCFWCGRLTYRMQRGQKVFHDQTATRDHIVPKSRGGGHHLSNLVLACHDCNKKRGDMDAEAFGLLMWTKRKRLIDDAACVSIGGLTLRSG